MYTDLAQHIITIDTDCTLGDLDDLDDLYDLDRDLCSRCELCFRS